MQQTDLREVRPLKVKGWTQEWERVEGRGPEGAASRQSAAAVSDKWSAGVSAFACPRAGDVMITRGVSHRRLRDISWAVVFWDSPPSAGPGDEMTYCFPPRTCAHFTRVNKQIWADADDPLPSSMKERWWHEWCIVLLYSTNMDMHTHRRCRRKTVTWMLL